MADPGPYPPPGPAAAPTGPPAPIYPSVPPGYVPPGPAQAAAAPPSWAQVGVPQPQPGWGPPPGGHPQAGYLQLAPAHKPGAIPLRPLGLGDIFDGAFKIIRFNPRATIGSAVLVTSVAMTIPIIVTAVLTAYVNLSLDQSSSSTAGFVGAYGSTLIASILQWFGLLFVTGMVIHVTAAAAIGRRLTLGEAWAATAGKRGALVGLSLLLALITVVYVGVSIGVIALVAVVLPTVAAVIVGIGLGLAATAGLLVFWIRVYYLAVPPLMLEPVGVGTAMRRAWSLTSRQFWRIFGIALLTLLMTRIIGGILSVPFTLGGLLVTAADNGSSAVLLFVVFNSLSAVFASAFVAPFTSAVISLQYIDQRIRKEGYDVELMTRAGIPGQ